MNIIDDIGLITVFLLILLSGFLFVNGSQNKTANTLFGLFLLVTSFGISALFLDVFYERFTQLNLVRAASVFLQIPLFYFYIKKACYCDFKLAWKHLLHAVPFLVFGMLFLVYGVSDRLDVVFVIISQLQFYIYISLVFYEIIKYKRIHNENHSLQNEAYRWLMTTTILFTLGNSLILLRGIFQALNDYQSFPLLNVGISLFGLGVISWFVLKTMRHPHLFTSVYQHSKLGTTVVNSKNDYEEEIQRLSKYMQMHQPYLEESLTLQSLADKIGLPEKQLSFLINKVLDQHFFDFINNYRIEEAKSLLQQGDLNIQQIMFKVGFNSKSSFNTSFKKYTSSTPSKYRESIKFSK
ncbi:MAG: helix-turn-helix domain-containing protein [Ekhidna sp.]